MMEPAHTKKGTASRGNESVACTIFCTNIRSGRPSAKTKKDSAAIAMHKAIGMSIANRPNMRAAGSSSAVTVRLPPSPAR
jgi:hypothetical protein